MMVSDSFDMREIPPDGSTPLVEQVDLPTIRIDVMEVSNRWTRSWVYSRSERCLMRCRMSCSVNQSQQILKLKWQAVMSRPYR